MAQRTIAWFSCGAASAVAAKLAFRQYPECEVAYCDTSKSEHWDNKRFFDDVERWLGHKITVIKSSQYESVDDVFEKTRYMSGPAGARCTVEMKKLPRFEFQRPDDIHVFGYTVDEQKRIERFVANNPELNLAWVLRDYGITKKDCFAWLAEAGIELPAMYQLGYKNNNCIGCVKASSSKYWNRIRQDFPGTFDRRAKVSRDIGAKLVWYKGKRIFLDELPPAANDGIIESISCGPECGLETENNQASS